MRRDIPDEVFHEKLRELTEKHFQVKRELLKHGDPEITSTVHDALSFAMIETVWEGLIQLSVLDALSAGDALQKLVEHALRADAEIDALREIEHLDRQRMESQAELLIERGIWHRSMR